MLRSLRLTENGHQTGQDVNTNEVTNDLLRSFLPVNTPYHMSIDGIVYATKSFSQLQSLETSSIN